MKNQIYRFNPFNGKTGMLGKRSFHQLGQRVSWFAVIGLAAVGLLASGSAAKSQVLVDWTFETSAPTTAGPFAPEINNLGNSTTPAATIAKPTGTLGTISSPSGNGSAHSFSANGWTAGEYFQFSLNTTGVTGPLGISFDQAGSSTGPRDFAVQYSTDGGTTFTTLANSAYQLTTASFAAGTANAAFTHSFDFTNVTDLTNVTSLVFRVTDQDTTSIGAGTVATTGTDRIDNFIVQTVPEPTTVLGGALLVCAAGWSQRRRLGGMCAA